LLLSNEQNFIKTWQHQEYYNTAMEGLSELEALLPALEAYASDSSVATTIKVAKDRIQAVNSVVPQAKLKYEAEPLKNQVGQVSAKLDVRYISLSLSVRVSLLYRAAADAMGNVYYNRTSSSRGTTRSTSTRPRRRSRSSRCSYRPWRSTRRTRT
jgi:hypothetical protein